MAGSTGKNKLKSRQFDLDTLYPINDTYVQFPIVADNDTSVALPIEKSPAYKFGGTWEEVWEDEAIFFRTKGTHLEASQDTNRTTGKQTDHSQGHIHQLRSTSGAVIGNVGIAGATLAINQLADGYTEPPSTDGTNGTPRTGAENYPVNRIIIVWKRTA